MKKIRDKKNDKKEISASSILEHAAEESSVTQKRAD